MPFPTSMQVRYKDTMQILYPCIVDDIQLFSVNALFRSEKCYLIGSRIKDRVISIKNKNTADNLLYLCTLMNGTKAIEDIQKIAFNKGITCNVAAVVEKLDSAGLLNTSPYTENNEIQITSKMVFSLPLKPPSQAIKSISRFIVRIFVPMLIILLMCTVFIFCKKTAYTYNTVLSPQLLIIMHVMFYFFLPFHEMGHVLVAWSSNVSIEAVKISLRWNIFPLFYIKYTHINFEEPIIKAKILIGGICVNIFLAVLFFLIFSLTGSMLFYVAAYVNISAVLISLYPHTISDGYYLLLILTNKSNIRLNALKWIFSDKKTKPSGSTVLFIILYLVLTCTGLFTTFLYFRKTVQAICIYFSFNPAYALCVIPVIYCFVIFWSLKKAKKIIQRK